MRRRRSRSRRLRDQVLERNREDDDKKFNVTEAMESTDRPSARSVGRSVTRADANAATKA